MRPYWADNLVQRRHGGTCHLERVTARNVEKPDSLLERAHMGTVHTSKWTKRCRCSTCHPRPKTASDASGPVIIVIDARTGSGRIDILYDSKNDLYIRSALPDRDIHALVFVCSPSRYVLCGIIGGSCWVR